QRLAVSLINKGHDVVDAHNDYDVMLAFIERTKPRRPGSKLVQRLDGIWFKPEMFETHNVGIKSCYDEADLVIWQSDFDRQMTTKWWGQPKKGTVIHNGIIVAPVTELSNPAIASLRASYEHVFVCSANWHPQKRL